MYLKKYEKYFYGDISELLNQEYYEYNKQKLKTYVKYGLKPLETRVFEEIRYLTIKYCKLKTRINEISIIFSEFEFKLAELVMLVHHIIRKWYDGILALMMRPLFLRMIQCVRLLLIGLLRIILMLQENMVPAIL
jgi:hypothetical protein